MKNLILIVFAFVSRICFSQDCNEIQKEVDKFDGKITFNSPTSNRPPMSLMKTIRNSKEASIYLSLEVIGITLNVGEKGVSIILADGNKIERPAEKIDVNSIEGGYAYSAFVRLTKGEIAKLLSSPVTDFRLYIYDKHIEEEQAKKLIEWLKCINEAK